MSVLKVRMLGRFDLSYEDTPVLLNKVANGKSVRLLQMLLLAGEAGMIKQELIDTLYTWDEYRAGGDRNRNLNNLIYRLKKQLVAAGMPEDEYVVIQDGVCYFRSRFQVELDVEQFRRQVYEARKLKGAERHRRYAAANAGYYGELLPGNHAEMWFYEKSLELKELYIETVHELEMDYRKQKDYKQLLEVLGRVAEIYPFDNWQTEMIRINLEINRYEEALNIYKKTLELYAREQGNPPTEEMQQCFEQIQQQRKGGSRSRGGAKREREILEQKLRIASAIFEEGGWMDGACYFSYPSFVDYCRLIARMHDRYGVWGTLMFVSLNRPDKRGAVRRDYFQKQMDLLQSAIGSSVRSGDAFTRYGNNSFVIMLVQAEKQDCSGVFGRIESHYRRLPQCGGDIWYYIATMEELEEITSKS